MERSQNPGALKRAKHEAGLGIEQLAAALEAVIVAPADQPRDLQPLLDAVDGFANVTLVLRQLQLLQLALLTTEIRQLLHDTLRDGAALERREIDLRLESAFVAVTDLPALLECALQRGGDSFELVFRLVNRLRKARGCAVVFSPAVLQKSEDVCFGKLFAEQGQRMRQLVEKQVSLLHKTTAALTQNPQDERALQGIGLVLENLELIARDHRSGAIFGIARGLVEAHDPLQHDAQALADCLRPLDVHAHGLLAASDEQAAIDQRGLALLLDRVAACTATSGRASIARTWYHLDAGVTRERRAEYRDILVGHCSKSAVTKCLLLVGEDCRNLLDAINEQAEAPATSRDKVREIFQAIRTAGDVLHMLGLHHLVQLIAADLPAAPGERLDDALRQAATLLHRINAELDSKLARMEREVVASVAALGDWERINASEARLLQNAGQILAAAIAAVEVGDTAADLPADPAAEAPSLQGASEKLALLADVLRSVQMPAQAAQLATAGAFIDWLLLQPSAAVVEQHKPTLLALLSGNLAAIEQLLYGSASAVADLVDQAAVQAAALTDLLQTPPPAAVAATSTALMIVPVTPATNDEQVDTPPAELAPVESVPPVVEAATPPVVAVQPAEPPPAVAVEPREEVDEALLAVFLEEADELLQSLDALLLRWTAAPDDKACLNEYLRALHTIKGSAALVCEHALSKLAHEYETFVLDARHGRRSFDAAFFQGCDDRLHALHAICGLYQRDADGHIVRASTPSQAEVTPPQAPAVTESPVAAPEAAVVTEVAASVPVAAAAEPAPTASTATAVDTPAETPTAEPPPETPAAPAEAPAVASASSERTPEPAETQAPDEFVRVSAKLLESLLNDADEISFARSKVETGVNDMASLLLELDATLSRFRASVVALDQQARSQSAASAANALSADSERRPDGFDALELDRYTVLQELAVSLAENVNDLEEVRGNLGARVRETTQVLAGQQRLANSLQDGLILTQMVPFASIVPRLRRLVRQTAGALGKPVRLEVENRQGSVDRSILQAIVTPLEHLVRNAIDHGIEAPALRAGLGKPEEAVLRITVARHGASVRIEIRDDGQGIDVEKVRQRAVRSGLVADDAVISEQDAYRLLFQSGFSTASAVSSISGRGVGLDVVRSELAQIGGSVEIESVRGAGTAFVLTLPLTSSLNRALVFALQDTRYVVLMNTLDGVITDRLANIHRRQQEGALLYDYGGRQYRYLYLGKLISDDLKPRLESIDSSISLLLVSSSSGNYALHIDAIIESRDLVVKTLGQQFAALQGIAGGVILPDGNVAIVLDLKAMVGALQQDAAAPVLPLPLTPRSALERQRKLVMVVDDSVTVRKATSAMLKRNGMDVITARNGVEAVELLGTSVPDLMLLDIEMPQMDGFEVASFVRSQQGPVRDLPIIMITSRIGDKHRSRAEAIGVNEYLCKPFKEDSLLASIREY